MHCSVRTKIRDVLGGVRRKICQTIILNTEAEKRQVIVASLHEEGDDEDDRKRRERPLICILGLNRRIQNNGYGFHTAYIFAPHWIMPQKKTGASKLFSSEFGNELWSRYIYPPGRGDGSPLDLVRDGRRTRVPLKMRATGGAPRQIRRHDARLGADPGGLLCRS